MPELPEVETIVRELREYAVGKEFSNVEGDLVDFNSEIKGLVIKAIKRRGKYIIFGLSGEKLLVIHLRMTGCLMWEVQAGREKYIRAVFSFTGGTQLIFSDVRKFGRIWFGEEKKLFKKSGISRLGLEPLESNLQNFHKVFPRRGILKNSLLRQDMISGIGNIYADEICFKAGLHPSIRIEKLKAEDIKRLYLSVQLCLREGIKHCGVSVSDFVGTRGELGKHQKYLQVYGRKGDPCYKCGSLIQKTKTAGRGTFYCPDCQRTGN